MVEILKLLVVFHQMPLPQDDFRPKKSDIISSLVPRISYRNYTFCPERPCTVIEIGSEKRVNCKQLWIKSTRTKAKTRSIWDDSSNVKCFTRIGFGSEFFWFKFKVNEWLWTWVHWFLHLKDSFMFVEFLLVVLV